MTLAAVYYGSALYHLSLWARAPVAMAAPGLRPWPGDGARGAALLAGEFHFGGEGVHSPSPPWDAAEVRPAFLAALHGFGWLSDLLAAPGDVSHAAAEWTRHWLDQCDAWAPIAWRADVLAERLTHWAEHFTAIARDDTLRARLLASYARQARHLHRVARKAAPGLPRLAAARGLVVAWAMLGQARHPQRALRRFLREVESQILPDGGHIERSPWAQAMALRHLIEVRDTLRSADLEVPDALQAAIDRATPMLRFFRHGDNRFALFNGANEGENGGIEHLLGRAENKSRPPTAAPYLGFQRLQAGRSLVIFDAGPPPGAGCDRDAHAGTLSFEMSHGKERLIVNCGAYHGPASEWRTITRSTAAHSTLVVADHNSAQVLSDSGLGRRPHSVTCERTEDQGSHWVEASHDGYVPAYGLVHTRTLFLSADGEDLRGEDRLTGPPGQNFCLRFHLHPSVQVSVIQDGAAALLRLSSGVGWRLRAQGAVMSLADSIYLGAGGQRKSCQLVLDAHVGSGGGIIKWGLRREQRPEHKKPPDGDDNDGG